MSGAFMTVSILVETTDRILSPLGPFGPGTTSNDAMFDGTDSSPFVSVAVAIKYQRPKVGRPTVACNVNPVSLTCVHALVDCEKYSEYF